MSWLAGGGGVTIRKLRCPVSGADNPDTTAAEVLAWRGDGLSGCSVCVCALQTTDDRVSMRSLLTTVRVNVNENKKYPTNPPNIHHNTHTGDHLYNLFIYEEPIFCLAGAAARYIQVI